MAGNMPHGFYNNPKAYMGFVGFVRVGQGMIVGQQGVDPISHLPYLIRATSASMNMKQAIERPDVIDSRYDRTVYQLGPKIVEGSFEFPAMYEVATNQDKTLFEILYRYAVTRDTYGLLSPFDMEVKYAQTELLAQNESEFDYKGCIVNSWKFAIAQSDFVKCNVDIIGLNRETPIIPLTAPKRTDPVDGCTDTTTSVDSLGTTRIVTWNDARVEIQDDKDLNVGGQYIRSFDININNNAERYYTLNTKLFAQAIAPRKRDISGVISVMGRHPQLSNVALNNELNCTSNAVVKFGFYTPGTGLGCDSSSFNVKIPNCVFEIEEMKLSNDLFETTINWHAFPGAGTGVCDPMLASIGNNSFDYENNA